MKTSLTAPQKLQFLSSIIFILILAPKIPLCQAPNLGAAKDYALLSNGPISATAQVACRGKVGSSGNISFNVITKSDFYPYNSGNVSTALLDLAAAISNIQSMTATNIASELGNHTFSSGTYRVMGLATLNGTITLSGDSSSVFIFDMKDSLKISKNAKIVLQGVRSDQVYYCVGKSLVCQDSVELSGTFLITESISIISSNTGIKSFLCEGAASFQTAQHVESSVSMGVGLLVPFKQLTACGLDYAMASEAFNMRVSSCPPVACSPLQGAGAGGGNLTIAGIPSNPIFVAAYLFVGIVGDWSANNGALPVTIKYGNTSVTYYANLAGTANNAATGWNNGAIDCFPNFPGCNTNGKLNFSNGATQTFVSQLNANFFINNNPGLNGTYTISGLPLLVCGANPQYDVNGATLIIVYQNPQNGNFKGHLTILDGEQTVLGLSCGQANLDVAVTNVPSTVQANTGKTFMLVSDFQDINPLNCNNANCNNGSGEDGYALAVNNSAVQSITLNPPANIWNQLTKSNLNFNTGANTANFRITTKTDRVAVSVQGIYYREDNQGCGGDHTYNNDVNASQLLSDLSQYVTNGFWIMNYLGKIIFNASLVIDHDLIFVGCPDITFGPNGKVIYSASGPTEFGVYNSTLKAGCCQVWQGIYLNNKNHIFNTGAYSVIQDAAIALHITNDGTANIFDCTFDKNYVDIAISSCANLSGLQIGNTTFKCSGPILPPYQLNTFTLRSISVTSSSNVTIGLTFDPIYLNTFQDYTSEAIFIYNSDVNVYHSQFLSGGSGNTGYGIYAQATFPQVHNLVIGGFPSNNNTSWFANSFSNHKWGIYISGPFSTRVVGNTFNNNLYWSVKATGNTKTLNILSNFIYDTQIGTWVTLNPNVMPYTLIDKNTISNISASYKANNIAAILDDELNNPQNHGCRITGNTNNDFNVGIQATNQGMLVIDGNTISFNIVPSGLNPCGIRSIGCVAPSITANYLYSAAVWSPGVYGISVEQNSTSPYICGNTTQSFSTGINCSGNMIAGTKIKRNVMTLCTEGFALRPYNYLSSSEVGQQGDFLSSKASDNQWIGNTYDSYYYYSNHAVPHSDFVYKPTPYLPGSFTPLNNGQFFSIVMNPLPVNVYGITAQCWLNNDWKLADDSSGDIPMEIPYDSTIDDQLNSYLENQPPLTTNHPTEERWLRNYSCEKVIVNDPLIDHSLNAIADFTDTLDNHAVGQFLHIDSLAGEIASLLDSSEVNIDSTIINEILKQNSNIGETNSIERYIKEVNEIYYRSIGGGLDTLTGEQKNTLNLIANLCPEYYVESVFRARVILNSRDTSYHIFTDNCDSFNFRLSDQLKSHLNVYPNPAENNATVTFGITAKEGDRLLVFDIFGNIQFSVPLEDSLSFLKLDLTGYRSGIYIVDFVRENLTTDRIKLVVVK